MSGDHGERVGRGHATADLTALTRLVHELLDAHVDTVELALGYEDDIAWNMHLGYLEGLHGAREPALGPRHVALCDELEGWSNCRRDRLSPISGEAGFDAQLSHRERVLRHGRRQLTTPDRSERLGDAVHPDHGDIPGLAQPPGGVNGTKSHLVVDREDAVDALRAADQLHGSVVRLLAVEVRRH